MIAVCFHPTPAYVSHAATFQVTALWVLHIDYITYVPFWFKSCAALLNLTMKIEDSVRVFRKI
jgi:hypothetical protein